MEIKKDETPKVEWFDAEKLADEFFHPADEDVFTEEPLVAGLVRVHFLENHLTVQFVKIEGGGMGAFYPGGNKINSDYHAKKLLGYVHFVMVPKVNVKPK